MNRQSKILFLFNHDAAHQAAHIVGIMAEMVTHYPQIHVIAACGTPVIQGVIEAMLSADISAQINWRPLSIPAALDRALGPINMVAPVRRVARLYANMELFASVDIVVSTERTCLRVKRKLGPRSPKFAYVPHGSGDRNVAYHPELKQYDIFLLSGQKLIDEMVAHGITTAAQCHLIGYPKFDSVDRLATPRFFENDNPVFLYNPHFDPLLSSWYDHGAAILGYFRDNADRFNLIFAPHVMLFRKKLHVSLEYRTARLRPDIPAEFQNCANILIDTDGPNLFDMSYTLSADAYIGDMSSQVYEFLIRRRPCFFIDTHSKMDAGAPPAYPFWGNGPICKNIEDLSPLIPDWRLYGEKYRAAQDRLFSYTIDDNTSQSASLRGASALAEYARKE